MRASVQEHQICSICSARYVCLTCFSLPIRPLRMEGFRVVKLEEVAHCLDVLITATGQLLLSMAKHLMVAENARGLYVYLCGIMYWEILCTIFGSKISWNLVFVVYDYFQL